MKMLFPGFKKKALTFSYDDGCCQDRQLIALFDKYGAKATFNLNSSRFGEEGNITHQGFTVPFDKVSRDEVCKLYENHEIGFHGAEHLSLNTLTPDELYHEISDDIDALQMYAPYPITGGAYANGVCSKFTALALEAMGVSYCRTIKSTGKFSLPENFLLWHPTMHDRDEKAFEICDEFMADSDDIKLFYIWGHSFELDKNDIDRWAHLEEILKKCAKDNVWCAANGEICAYVKAFGYLCESGEYADNPTNITIFAERDGKMYEIAPLSRVFFE